MLMLHYNKSNGIFSVRKSSTREIIKATERHAKIPTIGSAFKLSNNVFALITTGTFKKTQTGSRQFVPVVVTKFPRLRLIFMRLKEIF
ncbi:MAG: hypothetical protein [Caudoviricetes sp.]|nr:MAG: hypothetical protein [Caudoviricetes sp.]